MAKVKVTINVDEALLEAIDTRAKARSVPRSAWIAKACEVLLSQGSVTLTYTDKIETTTERTVTL